MTRQIFHVAIATIFWIVFAYYWHLVSRRPINPDTITAMVSLGGLAFLTILFLTFWIYHNIRIAHKMGRRNARRERPEDPNRDFLGRWIVAKRPSELRRAGHIIVEVKTTTVNGRTIQEKIFREEGTPA